MAVDQASLGAFGDLATALGLLLPDGQPNPAWFGDPVGGGSGTEPHGLQHVIADPAQRDALLRFVDDVLGPPEQRTVGGQRWVPLFDTDDPDVTVYAVVDDGSATGTAVHLGLGLTHTTSGGPPRATTTVHVPLFRFAERDQALPAAGPTPAWLLLGRAGGSIEIGVDATFTDTAPPPGEPSLAGVGATVRLPTDGAGVGFAVTLRDLQLPGAPAPRTFTLDVSEATSPDELLGDVLDLVGGLVRAQAEALTLAGPDLRRFAGLAGMLGLRDVPGLPLLPLAELPVRGLDALVEWAEAVVGDDNARDAWLGELARLLDADLDATRDAVTLDLDPLRLTLGVRVITGTGGRPVLVPWLELALDTRAGAVARATADLLRADTGTGACTAFPDVRVEAAFGSEAGGTALITGTDPRVGGLRVGIGLASGTTPLVPAFRLTLHDVQLGRHHDVLDLSTPEAALDAGASVVGGALTTALAALGPAGDLIADLLGLDPPGGVPALDAAALLADPLAALRAYWTALLADTDALAELLPSLRELLTGDEAALPGEGTAAVPWVLPLVGPLDLQLHLSGTALHADLVVAADTVVLSGVTATTTLRVRAVSLDPTTGTVAFLSGATGGLRLARSDGSVSRWYAGDLALVAQDVAVELTWTAGSGPVVALLADDLAIEVDAAGRFNRSRISVPVPLPVVESGRLTFPAPDWAAIETALAALVARVGVPELDAALALLGWGAAGPRLALEGLLGADPAAAVRAWLADLVLDCDRVRTALGPVAALLSGFTLTAPLGSGGLRDPFRCPVAGEPRAPGLAVWCDPGCAVPRSRVRLDLDPLAGEVPDPEAVAAALRGVTLPDVADLVLGRASLGAGLSQLADRWAGTDGLVGRPVTLPAQVTAVDVEGMSYDELVALGLTGALAGEVLDPVPAAVVHVGCEPGWVAADRPAGSAFDLTAPDLPARPTSAPAATGPGAWTVRLPTPAEAAAARPDRGGVGEQAARLVALLADRNDPVTLVGYGPAGAAVVQAAATLAADPAAPDVAVATVGTPWGEVATSALTAGLSGDALLLLGRLTRSDAEAWPPALLAYECTPLQRARLLVARSLGLASTLPPPATPVPGLPVTAVFGVLTRDDLLRGLAAHVADGVEARLDALTAEAPGPVTAVHAALDLPVVDLDLGGLLVGCGAAVEVLRVGREDADLAAEAVRGVVVSLRLGVRDGWLVGGPGSADATGDLRWMSARIEVPLDGGEGDSELVLHDVRGLGVDRERWVVRADEVVPDPPSVEVDAAVTGAVPEVRVLLSAVAARLSAASPDLATLLDVLGLTRAGGLDPDALDRLLHDPATTLRARLALDPARAAGALRAVVPAATGAGAAVRWAVGPATLGLDLGAGAVTAGLTLDVDGAAALTLTLTAGGASTQATLAVGGVHPELGGLRLTGTAATGAAPAAALEWGRPGAPVRTVALWPAPDTGGLRDLAVAAVPALGLKTLAAAALQEVSAVGRPLLERALAVVGMLPVTSAGTPALALPLGLVTDPVAWFAAQTRTGASLTLGAAGVALLDALAPLVVPGRGTTPGWPLAEGVRLGYADDAGRLRLVLTADLTADLGGTTVSTALTAGLVLGLGTPPQPTVALDLRINAGGAAGGAAGGPGVRLRLDPDLQVQLLRAGAGPLPVFPTGPGFADLLDTTAGLLLPRVLDLLAELRTGPAGIRRDVGQLVSDVGDALALRIGGGDFDDAAIRDFAADPVAALLVRLPHLLGAAAAALAQALDPGGDLVAVTAAPGLTTFAFGEDGSFTVGLDTTGATAAVVLGAAWTVPDVGPVVLEQLRLSAAGVLVAARLGPVPVAAGPVALRPVLEVKAGTAAGSDRLIGLGLALDDAGDRSVQVRWTLDAQPPRLAAVTQGATPAAADLVDEAAAPAWLLSIAVGLAGGVLAEGLDDLLDARTVRMLRGVVLSESANAAAKAVDPGFALDLLDPDAVLGRLERLLWNLATDTEPLSLTIDELVTISLAASGSGNDRQLGVGLTLVEGRRFPLAQGDVTVELEVDASWLDPAVAPGLTVYAVRGVRTPGTPATYAFSLEPGVSVAGLGLRFTNAAGPLLELGPVSLDGIALRVYAEAVTAGLGGGVQLELTGLAFAPSGGGGANPVAGSIMADAAQSSPSARPAFSPAVAVQQHPGETGPKVTVRAGRPPGPWWLVIQRQLGPLYLEQVGFDTSEVEGRVTSVTLLFDGRVEIFGLTAAVEQLSLTWLGGDLFAIDQWAVDLMGLAVSADMSGVSLAGGMLKTVDTLPTGGKVVSYVGMLMGKFGVYGLTVFGGYTDDAGNPSFFVFGAFNGPIGGPPAFFLTGIGGGLGINRRLVIPPDPAEFPSYPFIYALDPYATVPEPMQALKDLNAFFGPERGTFWFAAGISFTCFSLVDGIAVIAVSFGDAGLEINLLGLARLALPNPAAPLISIELGLLARFSTVEGVFMIRAGLTDNSWLLYEDVRLTGGFAFVVWWKGALAGQFVLTIGGYHPDFRREGYPDVARVGLSWQVTEDISIKGGSYFALTSEAVMAGVGVQAVANFGWAWARADFGADGLVYFDPFWFDARVRATISAGVKVDTWLGTISFSLTTGCGVHVWGPDFSGEATVQVGPCSVTIPFGSGSQRPGIRQEWPGFVEKYLEDAGDGTARALSAITGRGSLPAATGGERAAPTPDGTAERPFEVFAEFELTVTSTLPTNVFGLGGLGDYPVPVRLPDGASAALGLNPMQAGGLTSRLAFGLERLDQDDERWDDAPLELTRMLANVEADDPAPDGSRITTGSFPIGVWGQPDPPGTPAPALPTGDVLTTGMQLTLVATAVMPPPGPAVSYYRVDAGQRRPLPLRAAMAPRVRIRDDASGLDIPAPSSVAGALAEATRILHAPPPAPVAGGPLPNGRRSALDRASYAGQMSAPPLFGTLADGLATAIGDNTAREPLPSPPVAAARAPRAPRVVGFLASGADLAARTAGTTVSEARLPRRPAPTTDSVLGRLGRHLPVQLEVALPPGGKVARTFTPRVLPRTGTPGATRSYPLGTVAAAAAVGGLDGLGGSAAAPVTRRRTPPPPRLRAGDVVVLHAPDHARDADGRRRPGLAVDGAARVTTLRGDGVVLADRVQSGTAPVEPGTAWLVAQADAPVTPAEGLAGWHSRSRVISLGTGTAVAAGCVLTVDNLGAAATVAWCPAAEALRGADSVLTSFTGLDAPRAVVVVVEAADPDRVEDMSLDLLGAVRERAADGAPADPTLVVRGTQVAAVYSVAPVRPGMPGGPDTLPGAPVLAVRVATGSTWRLTGVLASAAPADEVAAVLSRHGVEATTARLTAPTGPGCAVTWKPAPRRRGRSG